MVLRIEDTDVERSETRFESQLLDDLKWMGLDWDEGPDVGGAVRALSAERSAGDLSRACRAAGEGRQGLSVLLLAGGVGAGPRACAKASAAANLLWQVPHISIRRSRSAGAPHGEAAAIRLRIPEHPIRFHDIVHGPVEFSNEVVSDPIILRSSGIPVYNYVVVVDDALMEITHVIRGDDHLSNTPKQVALYEALGWPVPEFAHLSTILGADRERLSKRHGATSIANFREMGVLPEALMNYLALLGWAPSGGTREIFTPDELKKEFTLERVTPSAAVFDMEKLYWLNRHYIKESPPERIEKLAEPFFVRAGFLPENPDEQTRAWFSKVVALLTPSVDKLEQLPERAALIFADDAAAVNSPDNVEVLTSPKTAEVLAAFSQQLEGEMSAMTPERFKAIMNEVKAKTGAKGKELFHPVRIALTGSHSGPEFDKLIPILEEGSHLQLPRHVMNVRERLAAFRAAQGKC